jgi:hypothetical protein
MSFSNPAGQATAAASGYVRALLELLGSRDPLVVQEELVPWLRRRLSSVDEATLRRPERPGKWSVIEVVQHLADAELVMGFRIRMVLATDRPALQAYDQDLWVTELRYREGNLILARRLAPPQLERVGMHSERGEESVGLMLRLMAGHDLVHRRQIERILAAVAR